MTNSYEEREMKNYIFSIWRMPILAILYFRCSEQERNIISKDILKNKQYSKMRKKNNFFLDMVSELIVRKSTRNILYYRVRNHRKLSKVCKLFWPPLLSVEIGAESIGEELTIPHGNVVLYAKKIGKNCHVCPGAVVGQVKDGKFPVI